MNFFFRTTLIINNVKQMSKEVSPQFTIEDINKIKQFSKQKHVNIMFTKLAQMAEHIFNNFLKILKQMHT